MLDRVPYRILLALVFVPGPCILALFSNVDRLVMMLAPFGGAMIGLGVAYVLLREHKLPFTATWGDMRQKLAAKS